MTIKHGTDPQTTALVAEIVRHTAASLTDEQVSAILYFTPRAPERKPKNVTQGVCLYRLSRHDLSPGIFVVLTEETDIINQWSPFRLTSFGLAVRQELEVGLRPPT